MGEKKIKGRKRHIMVDTQGVLLTARIDGANEQDAESFLKMFEEKPINSISMIWADSAYRRAYLKEALADRKIELSIVGGGLKEGFWVPKDKIMNFEIPQKKFQVQPRRWVVERTFAWLNRNRRLSKDYEYLTDVSASYLYLGMSRILLRRLIKK